MAFLSTLSIKSAALLLLCLPQSISCGGTSPADEHYDYIVVGSGPGGGPLASKLARAGHSVLIVEAGDDQSANYNSEIPALFPFAYVDTSLRWDYFVRNYDDETRTLKNNHLTWLKTDGTYYVGNDPPAGAELLGLYYPRGGTLGGSSAINAMGAVLPSDSDWQNIADITGDNTWNPTHMRELFKNIEQNHYVAPGTPGHGFNGYFHTNSAPQSVWAGYDDLLDVLGAFSEDLGGDANDTLQAVLRDVNALSPSRDQAEGLFGQTFHQDTQPRRFSSRDYVLATAASYPLTIKLNTLATKLIFKNATKKVIGVEYLEGQSVYSADPRHDSTQTGTPGKVYADKEVIISAGVFNSPQLLKLSGIGPQAELAAHGIPVRVNLPGVGANMQDNHEVPIVGSAATDFGGPAPDPNAPACSYGAPRRPMHPPVNSIMKKTSAAALNERDMYSTGGTFAIRGFWPPTDSVPFDPPNTFALSTVKIHPRSKSGTVLLRSADPRDVPEINFHLFDTPDAALDVEAYLETVKWARRVFAAVPAPIGPLSPAEPPCTGGTPAADGTCDDDDDREWVKNQIFGHHATSTCAIGPVLDSKFRVKGVKGLRVVDASAFPRTPGPFPVLPTFLLSEKAAESILEDA
ncbi:related to choline dehydrogenase [Cephalotrichum gorgonifer]|uniref:Related to choline dehydrogenase n=1 Tax=Cephalotrichum gorgonifer TaxID=2041049 RepID=A0AAE8SWW3_9PEZI|nr:related to choline dehydrogenase [Cephalotrichum gorgonifer]